MSDPPSLALDVFHDEGATALFRAIEERKWHDALDIIRIFPEQAQTWVVSKESRWRRLPLHEVSLNLHCNL